MSGGDLIDDRWARERLGDLGGTLCLWCGIGAVGEDFICDECGEREGPEEEERLVSHLTTLEGKA